MSDKEEKEKNAEARRKARGATCYGCIYDLGNQEAHMDLGGCINGKTKHDESSDD